MKWLSIKKFLPPTGQDLILRIERKPGCDYIYDRYIIASLEALLDELDNPSSWYLSNGALYDDYIVTHFAIIDAVEKER